VSGTTPPPVGVAGAAPPKRWSTWLGIGALGFAVMILWYVLAGDGPRKQAENTGAAQGAAGTVQRVSLPPPEVPQAPPPQQGATAPRLTASNFTPPRIAPAPRPTKAAPIMAWEAPDDGNGSPQAAGRGGEGAEDEGNELSGRLQATKATASKARRLRNPALMITQGTMLPIIRETPINTQLPGFLRARLPVPVYGLTGTVELLPAGTKLVGEVQRAMMHGTTRTFVLWTRAETPDGVVIQLASPGTDALGTNGIEVDVHTNFWARFGGAIMLSFIDSGLQAAAIGASTLANTGDGGRQVNFNGVQSRGSSAAAAAVQNTVNIPPFGTAPQGSAEAVFVARDLDFSSVYSLRMR
jgi:type IV secretion system protein VirB10